MNKNTLKEAAKYVALGIFFGYLFYLVLIKDTAKIVKEGIVSFKLESKDSFVCGEIKTAVGCYKPSSKTIVIRNGRGFEGKEAFVLSYVQTKDFTQCGKWACWKDGIFYFAKPDWCQRVGLMAGGFELVKGLGLEKINGTNTVATIMHEFLHVLGYEHPNELNCSN